MSETCEECRWWQIIGVDGRRTGDDRYKGFCCREPETPVRWIEDTACRFYEPKEDGDVD